MTRDRIRLLDTGKRVIKQVARDDVTGLAAELAYRFFLSLFPFFIFLTTVGGFIAGALQIQDPTQQIVDLLSDTLPPEITGVLRPQLQELVATQQPGLLSLSLFSALVVATSGMNATIKVMNRAYDVSESRPFWRRYLLALGLTLLAGAFTIGAFLLVVIGQLFGRQLAAAFGLQGAYEALVTFARWPVALALLLVAIAFLYWAAPNLELSFKWITPGAVLFAVGWLAASYLLAVFAANFGSYNATYGALGGVALLLVWFYVTAFVMLVGAELNAVIDDQIEPERLGQQRQAKRAEAEGRRQSL